MIDRDSREGDESDSEWHGELVPGEEESYHHEGE